MEKIVNLSSHIQRDGQLFLKTESSVITGMLDLSLTGEEISFVNQECWLAGGSLLRLLSNSGTAGSQGNHDRDFFFPTARAMVMVFEKMIRDHCEIVRFNFIKRKVLHRTGVTADEIGCSSCSTEEIIASDRVRKTLFRKDLVTIELLSPHGVRYQLIAGFVGNDPVEIISQFDYTICQFATDGEYFYSSVNAWNDLLNRKLRYTGRPTNLRTAWRLQKFMKMGYRPTLHTFLVGIKSILMSPMYIGR